ncbi:uncharacterized protein LOC132270936 isoform X2 [Cornus florida]|uniref:uncharacterized protein LOC132270936 isoform X2 n=1 Tax=Cornus florida TaxID=4283 RepID=UPI00289C1C90|nr:uncharacterized protein LOC132270936 isoform X2 [Cornus florida]
MVAEKSFAVKLNIQCACVGCVGKVKKVLKKTKGVHSYTIDANEGMVTVSGTADPHALLAALRKHFKGAVLLPEQFESKSMQIVPAKPVHGVHDHPNTAPQLQQLSENNDQVSTLMKARASAAAADDDDDNNDHHDDDNDEDDSLAMSTTKEKQISHEHDLELKNYNKPFICSGCKELGFGPRFRCESCDYELHRECKECWISKSQISLEFFEGCTFKFFDQLANKICDACGKDICGFAYHSEAKDKSSLDLHPCCSKLESKLCIDGYDFELHYEVLSKCKWCNKKYLQGSKTATNISGWSYISARKRCHFHVYCVTEMVREAWRQGFIDHIDSVALKKLDTQLAVNWNRNSNRNDGRRESDHQFSRHTTKMFLKAIVGVLLGDPTMLLASFLVDMFT